MVTLERAVSGGLPLRYRFVLGVGERVAGCIERCVRIFSSHSRPLQPPTRRLRESCVLFHYATRLCGPLFILGLMPL